MTCSHIVELFERNFIVNSDDSPIVLYGTGEWTRIILTAFPECPIYGLLDGYLDKGELLGRKIISLDLLKGKRVKIIIVARKASELLIYKRISAFCKKNRIPIFNLEGEQINKEHDIEAMIPEWNVEDLFEKLLLYNYISFDIFDTLLLRRTIFREKVYQAMMKIKKLNFNFCLMRLQAEKELISENEEPSLELIYEYITRKTGISRELTRELLNLEIVLEMENLIPRRGIISLYKRLIDCGKTINLVSDMYFPEILLKKILSQNGIDQYKRLLISCECGLNKHNGLFDYYNYLFPEEKKAHVGDDRAADGLCAAQSGIVPFIIPSIMEMIVQKKSKEILINYTDDIPENIRGLSLSVLFDTNNLLSAKVWIQTGYQFGFGLVGPILFGWAEWIFKYYRKNKLEKILFLSRDGYLLEKVFQKFCSLNEMNLDVDYIIFSRSLGWQATIFTEEDIRELLSLPFSGTISDWLFDRFDIVADEERNFDNFDEIIFKHREAIFEKSNQVRHQYQDYLTKNNLLKSNLAIIDFVSSGTCQTRLEKITQQQFHGLYFERFISPYKTVKATDYIHTLWHTIPAYNYFLLEFFIKDPKPSVKSINGAGEFTYRKNHFNDEQLMLIQEVQRGALAFVDQYIAMNQLMKMDEDIDGFVKTCIELLNDKYLSINESLKKVMKGYDEFTNREINLG